MRIIKLRSLDQVVLAVDFEMITKCSGLIKTVTESTAFWGPIHIHNIKAETLRVIFEWGTYHKNDLPEDDNQAQGSNYIPEWDNQFLIKHHNLLPSLRHASFHLKIPKLQDYVRIREENLRAEMGRDKARNVRDHLESLCRESRKRREQMLKDKEIPKNEEVVRGLDMPDLDPIPENEQTVHNEQIVKKRRLGK